MRGSLRCASIPASFNQIAADFLAECYGLPVFPLSNYLNITLINSNPILHTSRLYTIFKDYSPGKTYATLPLFYEEWSLESSELLENMDAELFAIIAKLSGKDLAVNEITTLLEHYESTNALELTNKLNSIHSLKGLKTPAIVHSDKSLSPDFDSRYFIANYPFGLDILISFGQCAEVPTTNMLKVSDWYHKTAQTARTFSLRNYGISTVEDLKSFYL